MKTPRLTSTTLPRLPNLSVVSKQHVDYFKINGFLRLPRVVSPRQLSHLPTWIKDVKSWPGKTQKLYMQYEEVNSQGQNVLCTSENFAQCHAELNALLRSPTILDTMNDLLNSRRAFLFKEKINYKLPFAGGYPPHIDAPAYIHIDPEVQTHITLLICVEQATEENGCLQVVPGSHHKAIDTERDQTISRKWAEAQNWVSLPMQPGDALAFDSFLAHKSKDNQSSRGRALLYATYNGDKDLHDSYYRHRRACWPATAQRNPVDKYEEGASVYAWGTPMETVQAKL